MHPGHTDPTTIGDEWESNAFVRLWRGLDEEGDEHCTVEGQDATLVLWAPDYDGGNKAWVRWADGSRRHRAGQPRRARLAAVPVLDGLIDHAALFPPASMSLEDALAEDRAARESAHAAIIGRFVVPAGLLSDLPEERPALSVVLRTPDEAGPIGSYDGIEALELPLSDPRPRPSDLLAGFRELEPLGAEIYFELVLDESWRDSLPAAIGAVAALGARVKLRCGGCRTPRRVEQVALVIACLPGGRRAVQVRRPGCTMPYGAVTSTASSTSSRPRRTRTRELEDVLAEEDASALDTRAPDRSALHELRELHWRTPVDDLEELGLLS